MSYVDFSALIQLGVVFNFAFIFEHLEPVTLFKKIFDNLNTEFQESDRYIEHNIVLLEESFKTLEIQDGVRSMLLDQVKSLHRKIDIGRVNIEIRLNMSPAYFQSVCLLLAIYSIFLLFFLGDYKSHIYSNQAWPIFTGLTLLCISYYLIREVLHFYSLWKCAEKRPPYIKIILLVFSIFLLSYGIAFFIHISGLLPYVQTDFYKKIASNLRYMSLFLPFTSFIT